MKKFFEELSRRLREGGVESSNVEDRRLEIFLHGQPVLFVSPGNDVFLFPAGSNNPEASELYHRVAQTADEVYTYWNRYQALRREGVGEDDPKAPFRMAHEGTLNDGCFDNIFFYEAFHEFDNQSIEKSLTSENPLVRVLDRKSVV